MEILLVFLAVLTNKDPVSLFPPNDKWDMGKYGNFTQFKYIMDKLFIYF